MRELIIQLLNQFRANNHSTNFNHFLSQIMIDLSSCSNQEKDFSRIDFFNIDLSRIDFSFANLNCTIFKDANLDNAIFSYVKNLQSEQLIEAKNVESIHIDDNDCFNKLVLKLTLSERKNIKLEKQIEQHKKMEELLQCLLNKPYTITSSAVVIGSTAGHNLTVTNVNSSSVSASATPVNVDCEQQITALPIQEGSYVGATTARHALAFTQVAARGTAIAAGNDVCEDVGAIVDSEASLASVLPTLSKNNI